VIDTITSGQFQLNPVGVGGQNLTNGFVTFTNIANNGSVFYG
jgi:hypothetical protein